MVGLTELWLPILLSAVVVFVASSIMHAVLKYHESDYKPLPGESDVLEAMRKSGIDRGNYFFPHPGSHAAKNSPEFIAKCEQGPVGFAFIISNGPVAMGSTLAKWFIYLLAVSIMVAYVARLALIQAPVMSLIASIDYMRVFRVVSTVAFLAYAGSEPITAIWMGRKGSVVLKNMMDGLIYGLLTGGVFGWLWPQ